MKAVLAIALLLVLAPSAHAAGWSPPQRLQRRQRAQFGARAARRGRGRRDGLVAWTSGDGRLVASFGDRRGRFSAPVTRRAQARVDYAVAPGAVAYEAADGIHVAVRTGAGFRDRRVATQHGLGDQRRHDRRRPARRLGRRRAPVPAPRQRQAVPRARPLARRRAAGSVGAVQDLGLGQFGIDARQTSALAVLPDGRAVLVFQRERRAHGFGAEPVVSRSARTAARSASRSSLGDTLTDAARDRRRRPGRAQRDAMASACGDAGCSGQPRAIRLDADGTPGPLPARPRPPDRAFAPWAARQRARLPAQDRRRSRSRARRRCARCARGRRPAPDADRASARPSRSRSPLAGGRTLALWATRKALGAALAGADGRFTHDRRPARPAAGAATTSTPPTATPAPRAATRSSRGRAAGRSRVRCGISE